MIEILLALIVLGAITILANLADKDERLKPILYISIFALNGLITITPLLAVLASENDLSTANAVGAVALGIIGGALGTLFLLRSVREAVAAFFPKPKRQPDASTSQAPPPQPSAPPPASFADSVMLGAAGQAYYTPTPVPTSSGNLGSNVSFSAKRGGLSEDKDTVARATTVGIGGFRPDSMVHMWAFILTVLFVCSQMYSVFLADGLDGLAEGITIGYGDLVAQLLILVLVPLLGVGFMMRRDWSAVVQRLALTRLTLPGIAVAFGTTFGLLVMLFIMSAIWQALVSTETFEQQTQASSALSASVTTLGIAFMIAFTAGVGEELAYRGALQPIFGFWFTTLVFVLSHTQYTLTPASLIIFFVAASFGLVRHYFNTTTAMLTHFLYNFAQLSLLLLAREFGAIEGLIVFLPYL